MAHTAGAYPDSCSIKRVEYSYSPLIVWDAGSQGYHPALVHWYPFIHHLYTKCLAQENNTVTRPGLEPGPFNPELAR